VGFLAKAGISGDVNGLFYGNPAQVGYQALSLVLAGGYSFVVTFVILKLVDLVIGLRVSSEEEEVGLDLSQHGERGYIMGVGELMVGESYGGASHGIPSLLSLPVQEPAVLHESR
jgi:Amt family ammonium transporter